MEINIMVARHSAFYSPLLMTICGGYLEEEGLQPKYHQATPQNTVEHAISTGQAHLSQYAVSGSFAALERNATSPMRHFAQINGRDGFFIAGRRKDPHFTWERLIDRDILVDHMYQPLTMFRYALHRQGIDEEEVRMIDAGSVEEIERAFRRGRGDYVHLQGPLPQQLQKERLGYPLAMLGEVIGPVAFSSLCASAEWLETDMARAFMRAYRRALVHVIEAPATDIARLESTFFPAVDPGVLTETIAAYQELGCWAADPVINAEAYEHLLDIFLYNGTITQRHEMSHCVVRPPDEPRN